MQHELRDRLLMIITVTKVGKKNRPEAEAPEKRRNQREAKSRQDIMFPVGPVLHFPDKLFLADGWGEGGPQPLQPRNYPTIE